MRFLYHAGGSAFGLSATDAYGHSLSVATDLPVKFEFDLILRARGSWPLA
jgi:hypothetical protein